MNQLNCRDGICEVPESQESANSALVNAAKRVVYVGDPMCSWCYGVAPVVVGLQQYCEANHIGFEMVMGGLRSGGGDQWNTQFQDFLRHEWQKIEETTGQPFHFGILDLEFFDYDTEPSCRAIVVARNLLPKDHQKSLTAFLGEVQRKFYFDNQDPKATQFYQSICEKLGINFSEFKVHFESPEAKHQTMEDFHLRSQLGVRGFPSFVLIKEDGISLLASGYTSLQSLTRKIEKR